MTERERERDIQFQLYKRDSSEFMKQRAEERSRSRIMTKAKDIVPSWNGHGYTAIIVDPEFGYYSMKTLQAFVQSIKPGGHNLMHKHDCEAILYILEGRGYSIIGDKKYEWEAGDTISIPDNEWHQHFNSDPEKPAKFFAVTNIPLMKALGKLTIVDKEYSETPI